ncbi:MAG: DUF6115 domain-containing protein [Thermodesulfobacteriota bacterium]
MSFNGLLILVLAQIGIDVALIIVFLMILRTMRDPQRKGILDKRVRLFESVLKEADTTSQKFNELLEDKHKLIRNLNEQLDKRILSLNVLCNRAEALLSKGRRQEQLNTDTNAQDSVREEILEFAEQGYETEHIAKKLSIPKGEVKLVLDMKRKSAQQKR